MSTKRITMSRGLLREGKLDLAELGDRMREQLLNRAALLPQVSSPQVKVDGDWLDLTIDLQVENWVQAGAIGNTLMDEVFTAVGLELEPDENDEVAPGLVFGGNSMLGG